MFCLPHRRVLPDRRVCLRRHGEESGSLEYPYILTVCSLFLSTLGVILVALTRNDVTNSTTVDLQQQRPVEASPTTTTPKTITPKLQLPRKKTQSSPREQNDPYTPDSNQCCSTGNTGEGGGRKGDDPHSLSPLSSSYGGDGGWGGGGGERVESGGDGGCSSSSLSSSDGGDVGFDGQDS